MVLFYPLLLWVYARLRGLPDVEIRSMVEDSTLAQFAYVAIVEALTVLFIYWFLKSYRISFAALGLIRPRLRDIGIALLAVPPYIISYLAFLSLLTALFPSINIQQEQQIGFDEAAGVAALALTYVSLAVLPPLVEEITMRGFLFTSLRKSLRFVGAAVVTSVVFALAHLQFGSGAPLLWVAAIDTFVLSLVLCYMRERTGSLWPGIFLHAFKNSAAFVSIFILNLT